MDTPDQIPTFVLTSILTRLEREVRMSVLEEVRKLDARVDVRDRLLLTWNFGIADRLANASACFRRRLMAGRCTGFPDLARSELD